MWERHSPVTVAGAAEDFPVSRGGHPSHFLPSSVLALPEGSTRTTDDVTPPLGALLRRGKRAQGFNFFTLSSAGVPPWHGGQCAL